MKKRKKIFAAFLGFALFAFVSGFCRGMVTPASADQGSFASPSSTMGDASRPGSSAVDPASVFRNISASPFERADVSSQETVHCPEENTGITAPTPASAATATPIPALDYLKAQEGSPVKNSVAPCCVNSHDGEQTTLPASTKDKTKFSVEASCQPGADTAHPETGRKSYVSSPSPPAEPEILSSVVKIE